MRLGDVAKHPVLDLSTATTLGQLGQAVVDAPGRRLAGFTLRKATDRGDWLAWERLTAFGPDAATVADPSAIGAPSEAERTLIEATRSMLKRRVLTERGVELAQLVDVDFDPDSGALEQLVLADGSTLPAERLLGVGRYATVVGDPAG